MKVPYNCRLYTELPHDILEDFRVKTSLKIFCLKQVSPGEDELVCFPLWQIGMKIDDHECITVAIPAEKEATLGYVTLAELGLRSRDEREVSQMITYSDPFFTGLPLM